MQPHTINRSHRVEPIARESQNGANRSYAQRDLINVYNCWNAKGKTANKHSISQKKKSKFDQSVLTHLVTLQITFSSHLTDSSDVWAHIFEGILISFTFLIFLAFSKFFQFFLCEIHFQIHSSFWTIFENLTKLKKIEKLAKIWNAKIFEYKKFWKIVEKTNVYTNSKRYEQYNQYTSIFFSNNWHSILFYWIISNPWLTN